MVKFSLAYVWSESFIGSKKMQKKGLDYDFKIT